jgi:hypothetical protein
VIHTYALQPQLIATWGKGREYRFICDGFGLGTPRVMLELPEFPTWKQDALRAAVDLELTEIEHKRVEELLKIFGDHRYQRDDAIYDELLSWLENAEREHDRKPFKAILATANPREHHAVALSHWIDPREPRWACPTGANPARTPEALEAVLRPMLSNCRALHLVDPHFGPENARHRNVLVALTRALPDHTDVYVHCSVKREAPLTPSLAFFEEEAARIAPQLPPTVTVRFVRWKEKKGRDRLHNRYVLTDLGGVSLGIGLDSGKEGETDDVLLLPHAQYQLRWRQYALHDGSFERVDTPAPIRGTRRPDARERRR